MQQEKSVKAALLLIALTCKIFTVNMTKHKGQQDVHCDYASAAGLKYLMIVIALT